MNTGKYTCMELRQKKIHYLCASIFRSLPPLSFTQYSPKFSALTFRSTTGWIAFSPTLSPSLCKSSPLRANPLRAGDCSKNID